MAAPKSTMGELFKQLQANEDELIAVNKWAGNLRKAQQAISVGALQLTEAQMQGLNLACSYKTLKKCKARLLKQHDELEGEIAGVAARIRDLQLQAAAYNKDAAMRPKIHVASSSHAAAEDRVGRRPRDGAFPSGAGLPPHDAAAMPSAAGTSVRSEVLERHWRQQLLGAHVDLTAPSPSSSDQGVLQQGLQQQQQQQQQQQGGSASASGSGARFSEGGMSWWVHGEGHTELVHGDRHTKRVHGDRHTERASQASSRGDMCPASASQRQLDGTRQQQQQQQQPPRPVTPGSPASSLAWAGSQDLSGYSVLNGECGDAAHADVLTSPATHGLKPAAPAPFSPGPACNWQPQQPQSPLRPQPTQQQMLLAQALWLSAKSPPFMALNPDATKTAPPEPASSYMPPQVRAEAALGATDAAGRHGARSDGMPQGGESRRGWEAGGSSQTGKVVCGEPSAQVSTDPSLEGWEGDTAAPHTGHAAAATTSAKRVSCSARSKTAHSMESPATPQAPAPGARPPPSLTPNTLPYEAAASAAPRTRHKESRSSPTPAAHTQPSANRGAAARLSSHASSHSRRSLAAEPTAGAPAQLHPVPLPVRAPTGASCGGQNKAAPSVPTHTAHPTPEPRSPGAAQPDAHARTPSGAAAAAALAGCMPAPLPPMHPKTPAQACMRSLRMGLPSSPAPSLPPGADTPQVNGGADAKASAPQVPSVPSPERSARSSRRAGQPAHASGRQASRSSSKPSLLHGSSVASGVHRGSLQPEEGSGAGSGLRAQQEGQAADAQVWAALEAGPRAAQQQKQLHVAEDADGQVEGLSSAGSPHGRHAHVQLQGIKTRPAAGSLLHDNLGAAEPPVSPKSERTALEAELFWLRRQVKQLAEALQKEQRKRREEKQRSSKHKARLLASLARAIGELEAMEIRSAKSGVL